MGVRGGEEGLITVDYTSAKKKGTKQEEDKNTIFAERSTRLRERDIGVA